MSAVEKAAEVLAGHVATSYPWRDWTCDCGVVIPLDPEDAKHEYLVPVRTLAVLAQHRAEVLADANLLADEPRVLPDVETVAQALHEADNARLVGAPHETVWLHLARAVLALFADAPTRAEVEVQALREFAERATPNMADAWGKNSTWLTTGTKVADLVRDWLLGAAIERGEGS